MQHPQAASRSGVAQAAAGIFSRLRTRAPRVHCITNAVAQNFTANVLLAAGCVPSMTLSAEEIGSFVAGAGSLLVNLGTFDRERRDAYKRLLAYVWVGDTLINAEMVSRGYAEVVRTPTDLVYRAKFLQLQDEARQAGRGLWQASAKLKGAGEERSHGRSGR